MSNARKNFHNIPYRFLSAADIWIFVNLFLVLCISIPEVNRYTHGTHITVAHAMGATIGINTMILFSSLYFIFESECPGKLSGYMKRIRFGFWTANISLLIFWLSLIGSGIIEALEKENRIAFQALMEKLLLWFHFFLLGGIGLFVGIIILVIPLLIEFSSKLMHEKKLFLKYKRT